MFVPEKTNRRGFLKGLGLTFAAAAVPYYVPASAIGSANAVAPSDKINIACVGVGSMGINNMRNFLRLNEVRVVAVCDVDSNHLAEAKRIVDEHYGNDDCATYHDFRQLYQRSDLDAASLSLPDHWHAIPAIEAARAGLDIYGEKPLSRTIVEGRKIVQAVESNGRMWQSGTWQRSGGNFHKAAELVRNGRIGKIHRVEVGLPDGHGGNVMPVQPVPEQLDWDFWLGPAPYVPYRGIAHWDWRWIMDYSGGQYTDWMGHHIDIALWGLGKKTDQPLAVHGRGQYPAQGIYNVPMRYKVDFKFADGMEMTVANQSDTPRGMGTVWYGSDGWIHVNRAGLWASSPDILQEPLGPGDVRLYRSTDHWYDFVRAVKTRQQPVAPVDQLHTACSIGLVGEIAMLTKRKLNWDPSAERFIDDQQADRYLCRPMRGPWHL